MRELGLAVNQNSPMLLSYENNEQGEGIHLSSVTAEQISLCYTKRCCTVAVSTFPFTSSGHPLEKTEDISTDT